MNLQYSNHIGLLGHLKQTAKMKQLLKVLGMFFREKKKLIYINYIFFFFIYYLFAVIFVSYCCKAAHKSLDRNDIYSTVECTPPLLPTEKKHIYG